MIIVLLSVYLLTCIAIAARIKVASLSPDDPHGRPLIEFNAPVTNNIEMGLFFSYYDTKTRIRNPLNSFCTATLFSEYS